MSHEKGFHLEPRLNGNLLILPNKVKYICHRLLYVHHSKYINMSSNLSNCKSFIKVFRSLHNNIHSSHSHTQTPLRPLQLANINPLIPQVKLEILSNSEFHGKMEHEISYLDHSYLQVLHS